MCQSPRLVLNEGFPPFDRNIVSIDTESVVVSKTINRMSLPKSNHFSHSHRTTSVPSTNFCPKAVTLITINSIHLTVLKGGNILVSYS